MRYIISIEVPDDLPLRTGMMTDLMRSESAYLRQATWERIEASGRPRFDDTLPVQIIVKLRGEVIASEPMLPPPPLVDAQVDAVFETDDYDDDHDYNYDEPWESDDDDA